MSENYKMIVRKLRIMEKNLYISEKSCNFAQSFAQEGENTMKNDIYSTLDKEPLQEIAKSRLAEYKAIEKEVDAEAERLTREELGMPEDQWWFGSCHTFWKHKKRILREKYHMRWRSPQDLNPETCFD